MSKSVMFADLGNWYDGINISCHTDNNTALFVYHLKFAFLFFAGGNSFAQPYSHAQRHVAYC